jgi:DeoR/GlpR family transcriptional regulator of sugar metabolism
MLINFTSSALSMMNEKFSARILALFQQHQRLQMKEIITLTNGRRATIKLRLNELSEAGYLKRYGAGRSTWYALG